MFDCKSLAQNGEFCFLTRLKIRYREYQPNYFRGKTLTIEYRRYSFYFIVHILNFSRMWDQLKRRNSYQALPTVETKKETDLFRDLHHPIFQSIRIIQVIEPRNKSLFFLTVPIFFFFLGGR